MSVANGVKKERKESFARPRTWVRESSEVEKSIPGPLVKGGKKEVWGRG